MQKTNKPGSNQTSRCDKPEHSTAGKNVSLNFIESINDIFLLRGILILLFDQLIQSIQDLICLPRGQWAFRLVAAVGSAVHNQSSIPVIFPSYPPK